MGQLAPPGQAEAFEAFEGAEKQGLEVTKTSKLGRCFSVPAYSD